MSGPRVSPTDALVESPSGDIELSVIMPCLNEAETLATCIENAQRWMAEAGVSGEVVIGDNGSTDGSQAIARRPARACVDVTRRGYGAALYHAALAARGRFIVMGDSDDSYDFCDSPRSSQTPRRLRPRDGQPLCRRHQARSDAVEEPLHRQSGAHRHRTHVFPQPRSRFPLRAARLPKDAFHRLDLRTTGMEFASEMVIKATLMPRVTEVPTTLRPDGRTRRRTCARGATAGATCASC